MTQAPVKATIEFHQGKWHGMLGNQILCRSYDQTRVIKQMANAGHRNVPIIGGVDVRDQEDENEAEDSQSQWPITQRFEFVTRLVTMVAKGSAKSLVITGPGGLGKTHTVREALTRAGLQDASSFECESPSRAYKQIKGYSTAKGLYRELFLNRNSVIMFDDCDDVLKDGTALNLLKGALDSYDKRIISWNADMKDDDLPRSFQFDGRVIFISNMPRKKIHEALLTRGYCVDLKMTLDQKLERMQYMCESDAFLPEFEMEHKRDAMALIREIGSRANEVSLRTLQAVTRIRAEGGEWRMLAEYALTND